MFAVPPQNLKVLVLGDAGAGKTDAVRAVQRLVESRAPAAREPESHGGGCEITCIRQDVDGAEVVVQLWDISGAKAHVGTRSAFYRDFDAVMCVFDATNKQSFHNLVVWLFELCFFGAAPPSRVLFPTDGPLDVESGDACVKARVLGPGAPVLVLSHKDDGQARPAPALPRVRPSLLERVLGTVDLEAWRTAAASEEGHSTLNQTCKFLAGAPVVPLRQCGAEWTPFLRRALKQPRHGGGSP